MASPAEWTFFLLFVFFLLALDLGVFHRKAHAVSLREAAVWSCVWVAISLLFNLWIWREHGPTPAIEFFTGYLIEKSLSVDNIFVFLVLFRYFNVEPRYQHRVLFWGIFGALVMRGVMIAAGVALIARFHWVLYIFGAFLVWAGVKMMFHKAEDIHPEHNPVFRWARKFLPVTKDYHGQKFLLREGGGWRFTPMFLVLLVVETTDLAFAVDSIPAIFGITHDAFIIFSSNVCAILGLRAMYFLLAGVMPYFRYLNYGLSAVLIFIGLKMLGEKWVEVPTWLSLLIVGGLLTVAVVASLLAARGDERDSAGKAEHTPMDENASWVERLASADSRQRQAAALELYRSGADRAQAAVRSWPTDKELAKLVSGPPIVGIAVLPERFEAIREAWANEGAAPPLANVPAEQDAREFEISFVHDGATSHLDILSTREASDPATQGDRGAIARFLSKQGEGVQQVEFPCKDVTRAAAILRQRFQIEPVYPETRPGAGGTRVNFFLVPLPGGGKVLIELFEPAARNPA